MWSKHFIDNDWDTSPASNGQRTFKQYPCSLSKKNEYNWESGVYKYYLEYCCMKYGWKNCDKSTTQHLAAFHWPGRFGFINTNPVKGYEADLCAASLKQFDWKFKYPSVCKHTTAHSQTYWQSCLNQNMGLCLHAFGAEELCYFLTVKITSLSIWLREGQFIINS